MGTWRVDVRSLRICSRYESQIHRGGFGLKHDLEDMLEIIKRLEERIILLERAVGSITSPISEDRWYWLH